MEYQERPFRRRTADAADEDRIICKRCNQLMAVRLPDGRIEIKGWGQDGATVYATPPLNIVCRRCKEDNEVLPAGTPKRQSGLGLPKPKN